MGTAAYIIIQCTWGILQTLAGFFVFLTQVRRPHSLYHGAIVTRWRSRFSLSLGMFIFLGERSSKAADRVLVHEYGHTLQSLVLGPLYLIVVGLPSLIRARSRKLAAKRRRTGRSYYDFCIERWASDWGEKALHRPAAR